jgi:hypothetical protein
VGGGGGGGIGIGGGGGGGFKLTGGGGGGLEIPESRLSLVARYSASLKSIRFLGVAGWRRWGVAGEI